MVAADVMADTAPGARIPVDSWRIQASMFNFGRRTVPARTHPVARVILREHSASPEPAPDCWALDAIHRRKLANDFAWLLSGHDRCGIHFACASRQFAGVKFVWPHTACGPNRLRMRCQMCFALSREMPRAFAACGTVPPFSAIQSARSAMRCDHPG